MQTIQQSKQKDKSQKYQGEAKLAMFSIRIPREVRRDLKTLAAQGESTVQSLTIRAITEFVERNRKG